MLHRRKMLGLLLGCPLCAAAQAAPGAHWGYEGEDGPDKWGSLDPEYKSCSTGCAQSPIDLHDAVAARIDGLALDWRRQTYTIVNNGHTIQAEGASGSSLRLGKEKFELTQFHFHTPSEHAIGGQKFAMEAHFVHKRENQLAVVGVLMTGGGRNSAFKSIMAVAPPQEGKAELQKPIDIRSFLPKSGPLYRYEGSLTIPPCSETVTWNLYGARLKVADADIEAFRKIYADNARPLQKVNRRFLLRRP